jgi:hypothetical protein
MSMGEGQNPDKPERIPAKSGRHRKDPLTELKSNPSV